MSQCKSPNPPFFFIANKPTKIPNHLVNNLIIITTEKEAENSTPNCCKDTPNDPSTTPVPKGRKDAYPNTIELEYIGITAH